MHKIELYDTNGFDFGLALGMGYKLKIDENIHLLFEYELQSGFLDVGGITLEARYDSRSSTTARNIRHSLNVGIVFNLMNGNKKDNEIPNTTIFNK